MSNEKGKVSPTGLPLTVRELETKLQQVGKDPEADGPFGVRLSVSGGIEGERYDFQFAASGEGRAQIGLRCQMTERAFEAKQYDLPREELANVLESVQVEEMAYLEAQSVRFPPDSLIGRLELSDGERTIVSFFMADAGQAATAGFEMPSFLEKTTEAIYELAARVLDTKDVRP